MRGQRDSDGRAAPGPTSLPLRWAMLAVVVGVVVATSLVGASLTSPASAPPSSPPTFPSVNASFGGFNGSLLSLYPEFLGVNVRADSPLSPSSATLLNSTDVRMVRWPGGAIADRFDPLGNGDRGLVYNDSGATQAPATTLAQFVAWCESLTCEAVITLPAEIGNVPEALAIVNYTEKTLAFHPTFWEMGNEPALWKHFGIPWSQWNTSQASTPTPSQYSNVVNRFVRAIRSVDDQTGILGLGGVGKGGSGQASWISSVVGPNGPNLSAVAIHVYPAGTGFPLDDLSAWFGSLSGSASIASRVQAADDTLRTTCSSCSISVLVDEFQAGTGLTAAEALSGGFLATYVAAEIVQALPLPVTSLDYYDYQGGTPGAWLDSQGNPSASLDLYQALASHLGAYAVQLNVTSSAEGLLAAVGGPTATGLESLLLVNTNTSYGFQVNLSRQFSDASAGSVWLFAGPSSVPTTGALTATIARNWAIPPTSVAILSGIGSPRYPMNVPRPPASSGRPIPSRAVPLDRFSLGAFVLVAPYSVTAGPFRTESTRASPRSLKAEQAPGASHELLGIWRSKPAGRR